MAADLWKPSREQLDAIATRSAREALLRGDPTKILELQWPGTVLDDFQIDIIGSFFYGDLCEIDIKGCTGAGKGCAVAIATNLWFDLFPDSTIIVTSTSFEHARTVLFAEIVRWRRKMQRPVHAKTLASSLSGPGNRSLLVANPETGEGFSGHHGRHVLFIFDEATAASDEYYDLAQTQARLIVALGNPRTLGGWFRRGFPRHDPNVTLTIPSRFGSKRCIMISGRDCRNVREGRVVIRNQITRERFEGIMAHSDPRFAKVFGLAEFPDEDPEKQLILPSWLLRHVVMPSEPIQVTAFGLDVAASEHGDHAAKRSSVLDIFD